MRFIANLPVSPPVKEFWKSVNIWGSYGQEFSVLFFETQCILNLTSSGGNKLDNYWVYCKCVLFTKSTNKTKNPVYYKQFSVHWLYRFSAFWLKWKCIRDHLFACLRICLLCTCCDVELRAFCNGRGSPDAVSRGVVWIANTLIASSTCPRGFAPDDPIRTCSQHLDHPDCVYK